MYPRDSFRWTTPFGRWIGEFGASRIVAALAHNPELSITSNAPYDWLRGHQPKPDRARALVALSGGSLSLDVIYGHKSEVERRHR